MFTYSFMTIVIDVTDNHLYSLRTAGDIVRGDDGKTGTITTTFNFFLPDDNPFEDGPFYLVTVEDPHYGYRFKLDWDDSPSLAQGLFSRSLEPHYRQPRPRDGAVFHFAAIEVIRVVRKPVGHPLAPVRGLDGLDGLGYRRALESQLAEANHADKELTQCS